MPNSGMRVLIVGINFAPEHAGIAPYTTIASEYLAQHGADVFVLTGIPHYPHWSVPPEFRYKIRCEERIGSVRVRRLRHYVPRTQSLVKRSLYETSFGLHVVAQRLPWHPDLVITTVPSLLGALAAARIAGRERVPVVVWVQDLMGAAAEQSGISGGAPAAVGIRALEGRLLRRAAKVLPVSDAFCGHLSLLGVSPERVHIIPNWSNLEPSDAPRDRLRRRYGWDQNRVIALHAGNMGLKQGLENVVAAARLAGSMGTRVHFVLMGDGSQRAALLASVTGGENLEFRNPVPAAELPGVLRAADILLVNEKVGVLDMSLPSKLTSYFAAGRPVVAAVDEAGGTAHEIRRSGGGLIVSSGQPGELLSAVRELSEEPEACNRLGIAGQTYARDYLSLDAAMTQLHSLLLSLL